MTDLENQATPALGDSAPDANVDRRPGIPKENRPLRPVARSHWREPERQSSDGMELLTEPSRLTPAATFGTRQPPRGVSGVLRRWAYTHPDYHARRWMLLIAADRVETFEHRLREPSLGMWALFVGVGVASVYGMVRRARA